MLRDEMSRTGQWLFVHRSHLPILFLPALAFIMAEGHVKAFLSPYVDFDLPGRWEYVWDGTCFAISMIGVLIRVVAIGYAPAGTSGRNTHAGQRADSLTTTGLYSLVRNPLYLGNLLATLGVFLTVRSWELIVVGFLGFILYYERIIAAEEAYLEDKFGEEYREWAASTPFLLPRLRGWRPSPRRFSPRKALRGEYQAVFGVVFSIFLFKLARDYLAGLPFEVDPVYGIAFVAAASLYVVVRTIKKRTRLLEVG